ncbi:MAG: hypothetical protein WDO19_32665 [Bacteroidota bacterium]
MISHRPASADISHPLYLPEYAGPLVQVKVFDKSSGIAVPNVTVYLSIPDEHFQFHSSISDSGGVCNFIVNNFLVAGKWCYKQMQKRTITTGLK